MPPCDAFWQAVKEGTVQDVRHYIETKRVNVNTRDQELGMTPLHHAAGNNNISVAEYLIEKGADVNAKHNTGWTPLHFVAIRLAVNPDAWVDMLILLDENGADFNAKDDRGKTPLDVITEFGAMFERAVQKTLKELESGRTRN